jgi:hypothetical protein
MRHEAYDAEWARELMKSANEAKEQRAKDMPDEAAALQVMMSAFTRLKELGWRDGTYAPRNNVLFDAIEVGSTGIHECVRRPQGDFWIAANGDLWPSRPILYRLRKVHADCVALECGAHKCRTPPCYVNVEVPCSAGSMVAPNFTNT